MMMVQRHDWVFALTTSVVFFLDRVTKMWATDALASGDIVVFPGFKCCLMLNNGISFGLFASPGGVSSWALTVAVAFIVALLVVGWRWYARTLIADLAFGCIIGGAVSNFVDRVTLGSVVDFIQLYYGVWSWPTFNIADTMIVIGFLCIVGEALYEANA